MRLRILALPSQPDVTADTYRTPFVLVVDEAAAEFQSQDAEQLLKGARGIGAEGVLIFASRVDLPSVDFETDEETPPEGEEAA